MADLRAAIAENQVVIVAGATGSGKTTQLPKVALELGRGQGRLIGVTQPRRIAATSVAARVASELECAIGSVVGYQIRFEDRSSRSTRLKFLTDGILLAEISGDPLLRRYDTLIIDEAHERSLTIDFLLGWLKRLLPQRRDLKLIISSATIETARFSDFFGGAPVIEVEGRTYPVDVLYEPPDPEIDLPEAVANAVENVTSLDPHGDILAFLPGEREIRETEQALLARQLRLTTVQPLYARLSAAEQNKVFSRISGRRVILATNVAETSLTIPGIVYVVDSGVARLSRYEPSTGITRLQIEGISQASADQRKGRCGRVREGICVRLYDETSFVTRPAFTDPEILRTGLAGVILRMKSLGLGAVEDFPFLDAPQGRAVSEGYRVLEELGALNDARELTKLGRELALFPVDPRLARMILAGSERGCLPQVLVLAAALGIQDPRERPRGLEHKADELHRRFRDERSDFAGLLKLWDFVRAARARGTGQLRRACKENFLSFLRVREWGEVHAQLEDTVRELTDVRSGQPRGRRRRGGKERGGNERAEAPAAAITAAPSAPAAEDDALHRALASGLLSRIGLYNPEQRNYTGARQTRFVIHPSSGLSKKPPAWVMAFELVQTTQLFGRTVAKLDPEWLDDIAAHLLKRSYADPHWAEKSARARIKEHATLFGLPVFRDRRVDYASIAPGPARLLFLEHALVRGEFTSRGAFQQHNRQLQAEVARLRDKARQSDMLADEEALLAFFERRVPADVHNGKRFEQWREQAERDEPRLLFLSLADVLSGADAIVPEQYPDALQLHGVELRLEYRFDPSAEDDGISVLLPMALLPQLDAGELDWTIPAWHEQKVSALLADLPRSVRRDLGPALAQQVAARLVPFRGPMFPALVEAIAAISGVRVPVESFRRELLPPHLRFTFRVLGERGNVLGSSRELEQLQREHGPRARELMRQSAAASNWQRTGLTRWDFGDLPEYVLRPVQGTELRSYPALVDRGSSVDLVLLESPSAAERASRAGIERLLRLLAQKPLAALSKRRPPPFPRGDGVPNARTAVEAFHEQLEGRVLREAFGLQGSAPLPRTQTAFLALGGFGLPRIDVAFDRLAKAIAGASAALDQTYRALKASASQPSGTHAARDLRVQLEALFPPDLLETLELERLEQLPRYLKAAQQRLARAIVDPRKDAEKNAPLAPLWQQFVERRPQLRDSVGAARWRWAFEELRVAVFAPELRAASAPSVANLVAALSALL
ncbi:MAG: hypothetical protein RL685_7199 [Pseudomonadota bacterium]